MIRKAALWFLSLAMLLCLMLPAQAEDDPVAALMNEMTLREKVGQLFIVRADALDPNQDNAQINDAWAQGNHALTDEMKAVLEDMPVGGVVLSGKNIEDQKQIMSFVKDLKKALAVPLFIAVDEEGGPVARLANTPSLNLPQYESAAAVGASGNAFDAAQMGKTMAAYLSLYGFNMDFAPVADVNTNPDNPVIGIRAFSDDAETVALLTRAFADELQKENVIPTFKHFPGHGDTAEDSHSGLAVTYKTREEMLDCEWLPYKTLTDRDAVMIAHVATPNVTGDMLPATLSAAVIEGILRTELQFDGVIITDSMDMGAITEGWGAGESCVLAFLAGCDILLGPEDFDVAFDAMMDAVGNGTITTERLDESVYRILTLKKAYGIL